MGTYPQQVDIRAGKDNFVGSVEVRSSLLTQNGAGLSGGAFALVLEHNFLMNNSVSIGSFAAKALNTTYPLHGESETPGEPLYRFDWWAAMPLWTCGGYTCRAIASEYGGPGGDYGSLTKTETTLLADITSGGTSGGFLILGPNGGGVRLQASVLDSTIARATASNGGAFYISGSATDTATCKYGTDCSRIESSVNSLTASGGWAKDAFKCDGLTAYSWTSGNRTSAMSMSWHQLSEVSSDGVQHRGSASTCRNKVLLQKNTISENMALVAKEGGNNLAFGGVMQAQGYLSLDFQGLLLSIMLLKPMVVSSIQLTGEPNGMLQHWQ